MKSWHAFALLAAGLALAASAKKTPPVAMAKMGVRVEGERIVMDDWGAWMTGAPETVAAAVEAGAGGAQGVTIALMRKALPEHRWPPRMGDPGFEQWGSIVRTVAEAFNIEPEPEPTRRPFRVVG